MSASWTEQASDAVKEDVAALLNSALDIVLSNLAGGLVARHFLILMDLDGRISARIELGRGDVGDLVETLLDDYGSLRAVLCVRESGDAANPVLRAFGDHREAPPFDCALHWRRARDSARLEITGSAITFSSWWLFE